MSSNVTIKGMGATNTFVKSVEEPGWTALQLYDQWGASGLLAAGSQVIRRISEYQAMRQSVCMSALDVLGQDIGKVRLNLIQDTRDQVVTLTPENHRWARRLMLKPNRWQTWVQFWMHLVPRYAMKQEALVYKRRASLRDVEPMLVPITAQETTHADPDGRFFYDVSASTMGEQAMLGFGSARLSEDDVIRIVGRSINGYQGLSTSVVGADVFGLNAMLIDFHAALVKGGTRPTGVVTLEGEMTDAQFERVKSQISEHMMRATNEGKPLIFEQGAEWKTISMDANATDLVKAKTQMALEAARLFRMPPHKVGLHESVKYDNMETLEKAYVDDTLVPICEVVEQAMTHSLLSEQEILAGLTFRFDREQLYDRDPAARRERIEKQFAAGLLYVNEARAQLGKPALPPEQDHRLIPVNQAIAFRDGTMRVLTSERKDPNAPNAPDTSQPPKTLRLVQNA